MTAPVTPAEAEFARQCGEAAERVAEVLSEYGQGVGLCVLPGVLASLMHVVGTDFDVMVGMLRSAYDDDATHPSVPV